MDDGLGSQHTDILSKLLEFQQQQLFCDFTVILKEGPVQVSRILIAAMSPVFKKMLSLEMAERKEREVTLGHISLATWTCITHYYFGDKKLVSAENVEEIMAVCDMYQMEQLKQHCSTFLASCLCHENCLGVKRIANQYNLNDLSEKAGAILAENFSAVCKCGDFFCLDKDEFLELLAKEELVTTEDDLCNAMLAWMQVTEADADTCTELFEMLHLEEMSNDCLGKHVLYHDVTKRTPAIESAVAQEVLTRLKSHLSKPAQKCPQKRRQRLKAENMVILGRSCGHSLQYLWAPELYEWCRIPPPPRTPDGLFCATLIGSFVVVTGGSDNKSTFLFDLLNKQWSVGPDLVYSRKYHGMAAVGECAYAVSGRGITSIEEFNRGNRSWTHIGNILMPADECGVTAIGEIILVAGGDTDECSSHIQTFNVETRVATVLDVRLPRPMRHVRATSYGSTACFLGKDGDLVLVNQEEKALWVTSHVRLAGFGSKTWFGVNVDLKCVRVIGGEESQAVTCWNFQGEKLPSSDIADLPVRMNVYAALPVKFDMF